MPHPTLLHQYGVQNSKTSGFGGRVTALHLTEKFSPLTVRTNSINASD